MKKVFLCVSVALMFALSSIVIYRHSVECSASTTNLQSVALQFLEQVAGFNTSDYQMNASSLSEPEWMWGAHHFGNSVTADIINSRGESKAFLHFIDGTFWYFQLDSSSWENFGTNELSFDDLLKTLIKVVNGYQAFFNASYCSDFAQLASSALQTQKLSVENRDFSLQIQRGSSALPRGIYATCYSKIDGENTSNFRSMQVGISKTGVATDIVDGMMIYYVATTNVTVSEEQALDMAEPYIQAFAKKNQREVTAITTAFRYERDGSEERGDTLAIYPEWTVSALYNQVSVYNTSEGYAYGYSVVIWADNGGFAVNEPAYGWPPTTNGNVGLLFLLIPAVIIMIFVLASGLYLYDRRKTKKPESHVKGNDVA
jgi:hypothetical protein